MTRWGVAAGALFACTAAGGCGRRVVGHVPIDGAADGAIGPGVIAWTYPGVPVGDGSPNVYVVPADANSAGFALLDRAHGAPVWEDKGPLRFHCFGQSTVVLSDLPAGPPAPGNYRAVILSSADGSTRRMLSLTNPNALSCWPGPDRLLLTERMDGHPYVTALAASTGAELWRRWVGEPLSPDRADVWYVGADAMYVSTFILAQQPYYPTSQINVVDTHEGVWKDGWAFPVLQNLAFVFDAGGEPIALDHSYGQHSVMAMQPSITGDPFWKYAPAADDFRVVTGGLGFAAVLDGEHLLIFDKTTWQRGNFFAHADPPYESWDARFMRSGDVHVVGRRGATAAHFVLTVDGEARLVWDAFGRPNADIWEAPDGTLYRTGDGTATRIDGWGNPIWTFSGEPIDRVIGADRGVVFVVGPPLECRPCVEHVIALDATDGHRLWKTAQPLPSPSAFFNADDDRVYVSVSPADFPPDGRITALWR
jgi:hypothetical protein